MVNYICKRIACKNRCREGPLLSKKFSYDFVCICHGGTLCYIMSFWHGWVNSNQQRSKYIVPQNPCVAPMFQFPLKHSHLPAPLNGFATRSSKYIFLLYFFLPFSFFFPPSLKPSFFFFFFVSFSFLPATIPRCPCLFTPSFPFLLFPSFLTATISRCP